MPLLLIRGIMKKIIFIILVLLLIVPFAFADRNTTTESTYRTSTLIKRGQGLVYSVTFTASANGGDFILYDAVDTEFAAGADLTPIKAEGSEVTSLGTQFQDFREKPLKFRTGIYIVVNSGYAIVSYE